MPRTDRAFDIRAKHPKRVHVDRQMKKIRMKKAARDQLPHLESDGTIELGDNKMANRPEREASQEPLARYRFQGENSDVYADEQACESRPYTTETLIHSVGPGLGLLILALVPLVWSVPEALIVGELASMLPEEGGYYRWVDRAFGRFWAFQNGWLTWMYSLVDMAIYPVLFNQYLRYFIPGLNAPVEWVISLGMIWSATWINIRGSLNVTRVSIIAGCFIMLGFLALSVASTPHITHIPWQPFASEHAHGLGGLAVGISIALWNYIGWDNPSTAQGEVKNPSRTYPRALAFALPIVTIGYFVPLLATLGASDWTTWTEGGWPQIAVSVSGSAGRWIAIWIALGGMISALALFNALLLGYSRIPFVLADDGLLPKPLAKLDVH